MKKTLLFLIITSMVWALPLYAVDTKISALTEDTAPTSDDLVPTVDAPGSSPANRKSTLANLFKWALVPGGSTNVTTITGNYAFGITLTNTTSVTFPTSGTLATTAGTLANTVLDDTKGNGDTAFVWSADKVYDQLALKQNADADLTTWAGITPSANLQTFLSTPNGRRKCGSRIIRDRGAGFRCRLSRHSGIILFARSDYKTRGFRVGMRY
jgi:hypothetical protein